jgi:nucleotide-binding universal stress UspA family protein
MPRSEAARRASDAIQEEARLHALIDELTFHERRAHEEAPPASDVVLVGRVIVGVAADPATAWATEWAEALGPVFNPHVTLVHAQAPLAYPGVWGAPVVPSQANLAVEQEKAGLRLLDDESARLRSAGLDVSIRQPGGGPVRELVKAAREEDADLIIVGSPTRGGLDRFLLGNVADGVKNHADTNVLLAKAPPAPGDVLCPVDGSPMSKRAATLALRVARAWGATLHVLHVLEPPSSATPEAGARTLHALRTELELPWSDLPKVDFRLLMGDPAAEISLDADRVGARLIVIGNRGLGGLRSLVAGSVTNYVTHHVAQSLILVKGPKFKTLDAGFVL